MSKWKDGTERSAADYYLDRLIAAKTGFEGCARCGGTHEELNWKRFDRPPPSDSGQYTAWATCPTTGDPILFEVQFPDGE